ncbi:SMI1/KNR4 family protein [Pseudomonas batumici]|uniref:SMI1/KNR4 family protein n=1 Tax=Pseudomonas batumici TaxID=226910 RepID=UPI0030D06DA1
MSDFFLDRVFEGDQLCRSFQCMGYVQSELEGIERLYNIKIGGQLKGFLSEMGRSSGGMIGDSLVQLYRPSWRVRQHLLFQVGFFNQMQDEGFYEFLKNPFVFSLISETQYYFLQTSSDEGDVVYLFDSNAGVVTKTEWDLVGFIKMLVSESESEVGVLAQGELLVI